MKSNIANYILSLLILAIVGMGCGRKQQAYQSQGTGASSLDPGQRGAYYDQSAAAQRTKKKSGFWFFGKRKQSSGYDQLKQEYYDRMEANAKKYKKMDKDMKKPQYSDPSYFGHKKKPKKRPPGKKKFCKECGIWH